MTSKKEKSEKELLKEISEKLDKISVLITIQGKDEDTQIGILKRQGMQAEEIGKLLGTKGRVRDKKGWKQN